MRLAAQLNMAALRLTPWIPSDLTNILRSMMGTEMKTGELVARMFV